MAQEIQQQGGAMTLGNYYRASVYAWLNNQYGIVTCDFIWNSQTGAFSDIYTSQLAANIDSSSGAQFAACLALGTTYLGVKVAPVLKTETALAGIVTNTYAAGGTVGPLPTQTCGLMRKQTALKGAAGRGRLYMPFPDVTALLDSGQPSSAYRGLCRVFTSYFVSNQTFTFGGSINTFVPVVYHRSAVPPFGTNITGYADSAEWATQRRRGDFGRTNPMVIT